jgi:hypothetical protein
VESLEQALTTAEEVGLSGSEVEVGRELLWRLRGEVQVRHVMHLICMISRAIFCRCKRIYGHVKSYA